MLSCDIGIKHMALSFTEKDTEASQEKRKYKSFIFTFEENTIQKQINTLKNHLEEILKLVSPEIVIIESQMPQTVNIQYMYAIMMFFSMRNIPFKLQQAKDKYRFLQCDPKNYKNQGVIEIMNNEFKDGSVELVYNKYPERKVKNHRWLNPELKAFMEENKIDKFDDISDTILILKYELGEK